MRPLFTQNKSRLCLQMYDVYLADLSDSSGVPSRGGCAGELKDVRVPTAAYTVDRKTLGAPHVTSS